jgi:hypothetical protein
MKFTVNVTGEALLGLPEQDFEVEAKDGDAAVDAARAKLEKLAPKEGGALNVKVEASQSWERVSRTPRGGEIRETVPAGEVSTFSVELEPHESVRAEVEAKRAAAEAAAQKAAERDAVKAELLAELEAQGKLVKSAEVSK